MKEETEEERLASGKDLTPEQKLIKTNSKVKYRLSLFLSTLSQIMSNYNTADLIVVNAQTGEELGEIGELIPDRAMKQIKILRRKKGKLFNEMFVDEGLTDWVARNAPPQALRMLMWMTSNMLQDNSIRDASLGNIAYKMDISRSSVRKAVAFLLATDLIAKDDEVNEATVYYVNPIYARKKGLRTFYYVSQKFRHETSPSLMNELGGYEGYEFKL